MGGGQKKAQSSTSEQRRGFWHKCLGGGVLGTYKTRSKVATGTGKLLLLIAEGATEAALTTGTTGGPFAVLAWGEGAGRGAGLLEGSRNDFGGQVEVVTEVLDALVGEVPVAPLPVELLFDEALRLEGGQELHYPQIGDVGILVLLHGQVLLGNNHTL